MLKVCYLIFFFKFLFILHMNYSFPSLLSTRSLPNLLFTFPLTP